MRPYSERMASPNVLLRLYLSEVSVGKTELGEVAVVPRSAQSSSIDSARVMDETRAAVKSASTKTLLW